MSTFYGQMQKQKQLHHVHKWDIAAQQVDAKPYTEMVQTHAKALAVFKPVNCECEYAMSAVAIACVVLSRQLVSCGSLGMHGE